MLFDKLKKAKAEKEEANIRERLLYEQGRMGIYSFFNFYYPSEREKATFEEMKKEYEEKEQEKEARRQAELAAQKAKLEEEYEAKKAAQKTEERLTIERITPELENSEKFQDLQEQIANSVETGFSAEFKRLWRRSTPDEQLEFVILWIQSKIDEKIDLYNEGLNFAKVVVRSIDTHGVDDNQMVTFIHCALNRDIYHAIKENQGIGFDQALYSMEEAQKRGGEIELLFEDYLTELGAFYRNPKFWKRYSRAMDLHYVATVFCKIARLDWSYKLINDGEYYPAGLDDYSKEHPDMLTVWNLIEKYDQ